MSYEQSLGIANRLAGSLAILIVFAVFAALALRTRNLRSFQFQFSAFMLLWAIAEFPQALGTLRIIDVRPISLTGLVFHTTSMTAFAFFVSYRFVPFMRTRPLLRYDEKTKQLLFEAIHEGLAATLGENTSKAVNFYVDPSIAVQNPEAYARGLRKMFRQGAKLLEERIAERLCEKAGVEPLKGKSLAEQVFAVATVLRKNE